MLKAQAQAEVWSLFSGLCGGEKKKGGASGRVSANGVETVPASLLDNTAVQKPSSPVGDQATHTRRGSTLFIVRHMSHDSGIEVTHANRGVTVSLDDSIAPEHREHMTRGWSCCEQTAAPVTFPTFSRAEALERYVETVARCRRPAILVYIIIRIPTVRGSSFPNRAHKR